jgi:hypothetical protein
MVAIPVEAILRWQNITDAVFDFYTREIDFDDLYLMFEDSNSITNECFSIMANEVVELFDKETMMKLHDLLEIYLTIDSFVSICSELDLELSFSEHALAMMQMCFSY